MAILKVTTNVNIPNPGDYQVSVSVSDAASNLLVESADTPVNVPVSGGDITVDPPSVVVV
jgi:hypothetical protein